MKFEAVEIARILLRCFVFWTDEKSSYLPCRKFSTLNKIAYIFWNERIERLDFVSCGVYLIVQAFKAMTSSISVAIVDHHPLMLGAIQRLLSDKDGFEIVGTGKTLASIGDLCRQTKPDVIIVDPMLPGDAYAAIAAALKISPLTRIVAFTGAGGVESAIRALDAGASAYVLKQSDDAELIQAVSSAHAGQTYITQSFASSVVGALRDSSLRRRAAEAVILNIREQQIVRLLMAGKTNKEIARAIDLSEKMVKHYMTRLMQKLQVRNRVEVVIAAQRFTENQPGAHSLSAAE